MKTITNSKEIEIDKEYYTLRLKYDCVVTGKVAHRVSLYHIVGLEGIVNDIEHAKFLIPIEEAAYAKVLYETNS